MNSLFTDLKTKDMLIDNTNDKVASEEEKAIWKILEEYGLNPMLQPNCSDEIITLVNKLFIQRVSGMFSEEKLKEAYEDGWNDYCVDCFMEFNADNYR
jgi:hypothetical protein